jgi:hypothetical protein
MLTVISLTNVQHIISAEHIALCGMFVAISMILSMSMAEVLSESKLWNGWVASTYDMHDAPLLLVFSAIVVYKILLVL